MRDLVEGSIVTTTLTIDPDVEVLLKKAVSGQRKTVEEVANDTLRRALARKPTNQQRPYRLRPCNLGIKAGLNLDKALRLSDQLEDEEIIRKLREGR
jgi:hypothetical protein